MRSIIEVTEAATETALTTLTRVKLELGITGSTYDAILEIKIDEASGDIEQAMGFRVPRETCSRTFWLENFESPPEYLIIDRSPVAEIASVTVDGAALDASRYRMDADTGQLFAVDASGYPELWSFCKSVVVAFDRGYILPAETGNTLPDGIQGACVELLQCYWFHKGRDPSLKAEEAPGIMRYEYWVGSVGDIDQLPPNVLSRLAPYRRPINVL